MLLIALAILLLAASTTAAQVDTTAKKRLRCPATVKGFIGGESHHSYLIRARKGQILNVQISWRRADDNHAEFVVSESPNCGAPVAFGKESDEGKRWRGQIPKAGHYCIYVTGHPTVHYTLRVKIKRQPVQLGS